MRSDGSLGQDGGEDEDRWLDERVMEERKTTEFVDGFVVDREDTKVLRMGRTTLDCENGRKVEPFTGKENTGNGAEFWRN